MNHDFCKTMRDILICVYVCVSSLDYKMLTDPTCGICYTTIARGLSWERPVRFIVFEADFQRHRTNVVWQDGQSRTSCYCRLNVPMWTERRRLAPINFSCSFRVSTAKNASLSASYLYTWSYRQCPIDSHHARIRFLKENVQWANGFESFSVYQPWSPREAQPSLSIYLDSIQKLS